MPERSEAGATTAPQGGFYAWYVVAVLTLANTSSFIDRQVLSMLLEPMKRDLALSDTQASLLAGLAFAVFYSLLGFPIGRLADRRSRRAIIGWGIAIWSAMCAACGLARTYGQLFLARVGVGVGEAALSPSAYSLMADYFPPTRLASAISVFSAGVFVGSGLAYLIGGTLIELVQGMAPWHLPIVGEVRSWQRVFLVVGAPGLALALLMLTVREPRRAQGGGDQSAPSGVLDWLKRNRGAYAGHGAATAIFSLVNYGTATWFPSFFIRQHGWTQGKVGLYMGGATIIFGALGVLAGGRFADWLKSRGYSDGNMRVGIAAAVVSMAAAIPLYFTKSEPVLLFSLVITNLAAAAPWGAVAAGIQEITPAPMRGQASALFLFLINVIGLAVGPTAVALITDRVFHDEMMVGLSLFYVTMIGRGLAAGAFALTLAPYRRALSAALDWKGS